jgi:EAL domain
MVWPDRTSCDSLKIDRLFVMGMDQKPQNVEIVRAVLTLGRALGKKVIAEGIVRQQRVASARRCARPERREPDIRWGARQLPAVALGARIIHLDDIASLATMGCDRAVVGG